MLRINSRFARCLIHSTSRRQTTSAPSATSSSSTEVQKIKETETKKDEITQSTKQTGTNQAVDPFDMSQNENPTLELLEAKRESYAQIRRMYEIPKHMNKAPQIEVWRLWVFAIPFSLGLFFLSTEVVNYFRKIRVTERKRLRDEIRSYGGDYMLGKGVVASMSRAPAKPEDIDYDQIDAEAKAAQQQNAK